MENNKLLIGVEFHSKKSDKKYTLEFYVLRDMTFNQLREGIKVGLEERDKEIGNNEPEKAEITEAINVFASCKNVQIAYFDANIRQHGGAFIESTEYEKALWEIGFLNSTVLIFDKDNNTQMSNSDGISVDTDKICAAFSPELGTTIKYPKYNI